MKKKVLATLLSVAMAMSIVTGCGSSADTTGNAPADAPAKEASAAEGDAQQEDLTLKIMLGIRDVDALTDVDQMPAVQRLEEQTGINIEWEVVKGSDWETKLNLMFASGEYPDIIIANNVSVDYEEYGVTQGLLQTLNDDLTSKYMPNYTARREAEEADPTASLIASDGNKYAIGYLVGQNINTNQHFFINNTWLENLGLETPKNAQELLEVLRTFKAKDADGDGDTSNEIPLEMGLDTGFYGIRYLLPMFGVPIDSDRWIYIDDDKNVVFAPTTDNFRDCMEWLHTCYAEGLVDPEIISQDISTIETKLKAGNVGFFTAWRLIAMGFDDSVMQTCSLYVPESTAKLSRILEVAKGGTYLTVTNEHVEESLKLLDAMLDTEMMFSLYYGEKDATDGTGWTYNENGKIDSINTGSVEIKNYIDCNTLFFAPANYIYENFNMPPQRIEKTEYCKIYDEAGIIQKYSNDYFKFAPLTSEQLQSITLKETDIDNAVVENVASFVVNGVTDDTWQQFVSIFAGMDT
nr:extracellular solute-binding protein [Lachnospiraceae bacterium]